MARESGSKDTGNSVLKKLDWWTIAIYVTLLVFGWISVCGASYTLDEPQLFSLESRAGMQLVWIGLAIILAIAILFIDKRLLEDYAFVVYVVMLAILLITVFNPYEIKGSRSWLVIGPLRVQPAEFSKFTTSLVLARFMSIYGYSINKWRDFIFTLTLILVPMLLIVLQRETGSALVYVAFFLMFYREGMPGAVLLVGISAVIYFVVGTKLQGEMFLFTQSDAGETVVLLLILLFTLILSSLCRGCRQFSIRLLEGVAGIFILMYLCTRYVMIFDLVWGLLILCAIIFTVILWRAIMLQVRSLYFVIAFLACSIAFFYSSGHVLNMMESHQRTRINVLLGLEEDPTGSGYNVNQSIIAIGSGGLKGKGFLNGTQTKLKFVPEQDTDFIFCTVGEEEGFAGSVAVLALFLSLILRLIFLSERQTKPFGRIYGYCVLSIFLFHVMINVGMVLGLMPVIGIPLPFFSYGGSSMWSFTILLFIFLRIDMGREKKLS